MIKLNPKFKPLFNSDSRFFVITGGRGSAKSFSVGAWSSLLSMERGHKILFTRQTMTSAHLSIVPEFQEKMELLDIGKYFNTNKSEIVNKGSGSEIIFKGLKTSSGDQTANLKSLQGVTTWIMDEAEELTDESIFDKINLSIRQKGKQNRVILILNPATKEHWIYKRFFQLAGIEPGFNGTKGNTTYIHTTYLDNAQHLDRSFLDEVARINRDNPKKYEHVILGGWLDKADGVVFDNWKFGAFNPDRLQTSFGQDFGFSVDPTTLVEVAIDRKQKIIYLKQHLYKTKLTTSEIAAFNIAKAGRNLIIGDSAEPRLIAELQKLRVNIIGAVKGPGSITVGVSIMQDYLLVVDPESENLASELNNHVYADKGSKLYVDNHNHIIDAIRYNVAFQLINNHKTDIR